jgi:hypothetical protein
VSALWISRPDLRELPLEFFCVDRCAPALEAGKNFFTAISGGSSPWKLHLLKEDIDFRKADVTRNKKKAAFVCAINIFNEVYEHLPHSDTNALRRMASNAVRIMSEKAADDAFFLTMEPGVPQSGHFISFLRDAFLEIGRSPVLPCPHGAACPLCDGKRWCHFAFEPQDAPKELQRLSAAAGIPKERLVFSFLLTGPAVQSTPAAAKTESEAVRVISDPFQLPGGRYGRYGCSSHGLVLLAGGKGKIEKISFGSLATPVFAEEEQRDEKSGALIIEVK